VRLLLDTHTVLWWFSDDPRLAIAARTAIADLSNQLVVSAAVGYEIGYKQNLRRLPPLPEILQIECCGKVSGPCRSRSTTRLPPQLFQGRTAILETGS